MFILKRLSWFLVFCTAELTLAQSALPAKLPKIDRQALVGRHAVVNTGFDTLGALSVGNGEFGFTVDPTGLQTFPDYYKKGVPLGTQSQWGWHNVPNTEGYSLAEVYKDVDQHGRQVPYTYAFSGTGRQAQASNWFRENPHRLHLCMIGFDLRKADGSEIKQTDLTNIRQTLDLWTGEIRSHFTIENVPVDVVTLCHPTQDLIAVQVRSPLVAMGRLKITLRFPYGATDWEGIPDFSHPAQHTTQLKLQGTNAAVLKRELDSTQYAVGLAWTGRATLRQQQAHYHGPPNQPRPMADLLVVGGRG